MDSIFEAMADMIVSPARRSRQLGYDRDSIIERIAQERPVWRHVTITYPPKQPTKPSVKPKGVLRAEDV